MELFKAANVVRLKSHHNKYLLADDDDDKEHVVQERNAASSRSSQWTVELPDPYSDRDAAILRLNSCHGLYLTASSEPFLLGMAGRKLIQALPRRLDSSVEWEPLRDGFQVRLRTRHSQLLRANGKRPPYRKSGTHDIPHRMSTRDWVLWDVVAVELS